MAESHSGPGAGFEYPVKEVSWLKREVLLFANSIGVGAGEGQGKPDGSNDELHFLYELHPKFAVFPTYPVILPFKYTNTELTDFYGMQRTVPIPGVPAFDSRRVVDGQRTVQFLKPLPPTSAGQHFDFHNKVVGVYDKGKASVVELQQEIVQRETGEVYSRAIGSSFFVGQGGWGGPKGPATVNYPPPSNRSPDVTIPHQIPATAALLYRLNGDYNPLHATPEPGAAMGFGGVIMHGLYSWNVSCVLLLRHLAGSDPAAIKEFGARFASPVKPGQKLQVVVWRLGNPDAEGWEEVRFVTKVFGDKDGGKGTVALSNGKAILKLSRAGKSRL